MNSETNWNSFKILAITISRGADISPVHRAPITGNRIQVIIETEKAADTSEIMVMETDIPVEHTNGKALPTETVHQVHPMAGITVTATGTIPSAVTMDMETGKADTTVTTDMETGKADISAGIPILPGKAINTAAVNAGSMVIVSRITAIRKGSRQVPVSIAVIMEPARKILPEKTGEHNFITR